MKSLAVVVFFSALIATSLPAAGSDGSSSAGPDMLVFTTGLDHYQTGGLGSNGSLDWIRHSRGSEIYTIGFGVFSNPASHWSFGRFGAVRPLNPKVSLQAEATVGAGGDAAGRFGYQIYEGELSYKCSRVLYVRAGDKFLSISDTHGHLLRSGIDLFPVRNLQAHVTYAHSASGNLGTQYVSSGLDLQLRKLAFVAGYSGGDVVPQNQDLLSQTISRGQVFHDAFFGIGLRVSKSELHIAYDVLIGNSQRQSVVIAWKIPLQRPGTHAHD